MNLQNDPMARLFGMELTGQTARGVITTARVEPKHLNPYSIAHGGFTYTIGCITAALSASLCLGRETEPASVSSQYLSALTPGLARCESTFVHDNGTNCTYRIQVTDASGRLCFTQLVTLHPAAKAAPPTLPHPRTILPPPPDAPIDPATGQQLPMIAPGSFGALTQTYLLGRREDVTTLGADILPETADEHGFAHCGLVYSVCDTAVGIASVYTGKVAVTVSSAVEYFRPAAVGPVTADARCVRDGHSVTYYESTAKDGGGNIIAAAQFSMHPIEMPDRASEQEAHHVH